MDRYLSIRNVRRHVYGLAITAAIRRATAGDKTHHCPIDLEMTDEESRRVGGTLR